MNAKFAAIFIISTSFFGNIAKAGCLETYKNAVSSLETSQESSALIGAMSGAFGGMLSIGSIEVPGLRMIAIPAIGAGFAVATIGAAANSPKDLKSASRLIDEAQKGDGLLIRMLKSDLERKGVHASIEQLAAKIGSLNEREILCPKAGSRQVALGYTAIRSLLSSGL